MEKNLFVNVWRKVKTKYWATIFFGHIKIIILVFFDHYYLKILKHSGRKFHKESQEKLELWVTSPSDIPRLQYYEVQTLEYRYISKLPMKKERIWSNAKVTTSHLQNKLTKNIHLGVTTRSSTKWDCLKRF